MNVLDLFSGIGGFSLGLERAGMRTVAFCEINKFCRRMLAVRWPGVPCYDDVRALTADRLKSDGISIDAICGGFPCQDISIAGNGKGIKEGTRSGLWIEYARIIGELRPKFIIVENVAALLDRGMGQVLGDLAGLGYDAEWHSLDAFYAGVPQYRPRVWIVAYPTQSRSEPVFSQDAEHVECYRSWVHGSGREYAHIDHENRGSCALSVLGNIEWTSIPDRERSGNNERLSAGMDRYRSLGNSVVPQIPELIGRAIMRASMVSSQDRT
jgi:DNA (cytosine-5)-methyltransferase 1